MEKAGVRRLICQSSLGIVESRADLGFLTKYMIVPIFLRLAFGDHEGKETVVKQSALDWTIIRPSRPERRSALTNPSALRRQPRPRPDRAGDCHRETLERLPASARNKPGARYEFRLSCSARLPRLGLTDMLEGAF